MTETELKARTKLFARRVLHLVEALPRSRSAAVVANQLGRSGTSVGANYRSACRARSTADFISKLGIVEEEADESAFWMELIIEEEMLPGKKVQPLWDEANAITAMMVSSRKTLGRRNQKAKIQSQK
ncbi:four helix bundle protein [Oleiharenicola lentus]|jgi:four helix bundle protein|uniref:Four helix bundle protein n=1 Tax=Oleiharenicola lentus TaxID=2508720 RepID=A0A4Q1C9U3_9BACT|nr:four helix bundle protein [Oleiharenicola lentus]RXK55764.1 four helix bundle protein [Oleiharenicola lentus]